MMIAVMDNPPPPRLALVGDRSPSVAAHTRIPELLGSLSLRGPDQLEPYWLHTSTIEGPGDLEGFDGVWVVPGSPYASSEGALAAVTYARTRGVPLLGTCGGFQHLLLEFARNVCGLREAGHAEIDPEAPDLLIVPLACKLFGEEDTVYVAEGTRAADVMGAGPSTERYFCRFGLDPAYEPVLEAAGLTVSGRSAGGEARVAELTDHPFFIAALFQPELSSDTTWVHPLIASFATAVRDRARLASARPA